MKRKTYVIGHRNPDTDSIVSAIAYAALKRQQGWSSCFPARAGKLTPQTEYILERFGIPAPEFIPDLVPKVSYFLSDTTGNIGIFSRSMVSRAFHKLVDSVTVTGVSERK
jgi:manganese-dependent inorganic pyrophosphatase